MYRFDFRTNRSTGGEAVSFSDDFCDGSIRPKFHMRDTYKKLHGFNFCMHSSLGGAVMLVFPSIFQIEICWLLKYEILILKNFD